MVKDIIIAILWFICSAMCLIQFLPACKQISKLDSVIVFFICLIGGPIFALNNILTELLNLILPEGWDDDDDFKKL